MRSWILLGSLIVVRGLNKEASLPLTMALIVTAMLIAGLIMDIIEFKERTL
jgi:hypothetical protein